jgi:hypothetical protein
MRVTGSAIGVPATIAPGRYWVAAGVAMVSDLVSPGFAPQLMGTTVSCFANLTVRSTTVRVSIHVTFARDRCAIQVTGT